MPQPGEVYFHSRFQYEDGTTGTKLIVVLNQQGEESLCLILKTTSQPARYKNAQKGCNPTLEVFYIPANWQGFDLPTYIQLLPIFPLTLQEFIRNGIHDIIQYKFTLTEDCFRQLLNCLKKYFREYISNYFYDLIFK